MKNIFIYANSKDSKYELGNLVNCYKILPDNFELPSTDAFDTNYIIADADLRADSLDILINTYKKYNAKFLAFTKNTTKDNILKLYDIGFDNVIPYVENLDDVIKNIINPENKDVDLKDIEKYRNSQRILILSDNKINAELLSTTLEHYNFIYTLRLINNEAKNDIQKDKYDLIIIDCKTIDPLILELVKAISKSKFNYSTPFLVLSDSFNEFNEFELYKNGACSYVEKPYAPSVLYAQVENILKIKELQDSLKKENHLLDNMITNSFNQLIITDMNFVVLSGGNQFVPVQKNEYFFNILNTQKIKFPQEEIRLFSRNSEKNLKFMFKTTEKTFECVISKVYKDDNFFEQYLIIIEDITEKLLIEEQKETFIATLTHDLKSPLRAEQNILKQMLDEKFGELNETQKSIIKEILNSKEYENKMIDNLLTRYHVTSSGFKLLVEENNYQKIVNESVNEISYLLETKKQNLSLNYDAQTEVFEFDKTEIKRVITNLLQNASEYSPNNTNIEIVVTEDEDEIITSVKDYGYGIKEENIHEIFNKNVTLAKKYRKVGAGLGLYICKTLITAHNGKITVESKPNVGTTFTFTLPKKYFRL